MFDVKKIIFSNIPMDINEKRKQWLLQNCKLRNLKSDCLQALQSSGRYLILRQVDDDIMFVIRCWHVFGIVYPLLIASICVGDVYVMVKQIAFV